MPPVSVCSARSGVGRRPEPATWIYSWGLVKSASWLDFASLHADLEILLGRKVDLIEEGQLPWALRPQIEAEAVPL